MFAEDLREDLKLTAEPEGVVLNARTGEHKRLGEGIFGFTMPVSDGSVVHDQSNEGVVTIKFCSSDTKLVATGSTPPATNEN